MYPKNHNLDPLDDHHMSICPVQFSLITHYLQDFLWHTVQEADAGDGTRAGGRQHPGPQPAPGPAGAGGSLPSKVISHNHDLQLVHFSVADQYCRLWFFGPLDPDYNFSKLTRPDCGSALYLQPSSPINDYNIYQLENRTEIFIISDVLTNFVVTIQET